MKPHVSANQLASFLTAKTPERKLALVRAVRRAAFSDKGYPPYYSSLKKPARSFLASGARDPSPLIRLIEAMAEQTGKTWHKTDARITAEAAKALMKLAPKLRALDVDFVHPAPGIKAKLEFPEIDVLLRPDMFVEKRQAGAVRVGAMRIYTAKNSNYEIGAKGAELVAAMQHQWLLRITSGATMPDGELCMVVECFQQRITRAPSDTTELMGRVEHGCREFMRLWHGLDSRNAA